MLHRGGKQVHVMFENRLCFGVGSEGNGTRCCAPAHSSLLMCPSSHPFHTQILGMLASPSPNSVFSEVNPGVLGSKCHCSVSSESGAAAPVPYLGVHPICSLSAGSALVPFQTPGVFPLLSSGWLQGCPGGRRVLVCRKESTNP